MANEDNLVRQGKADEAFNTAGQAIQQGHTIQQIQTQYATAVSVQRPRNLIEVQNRCLQEAELSGDTFYYRWEQNIKDKKTGQTTKKWLTGGSIDCALTLVRNFGNAVVQQRPVQETRTAWVFTAAFIDLETGFTLERQFRMDKNFPVYGKHDEYRKADIRFQIGQSKAIRNVVFNSTPSAIKNRMVDAAFNSVRKVIIKKMEAAKGDIMAVINPLLEAFKSFGVTSEMIENKIGVKVGHWDIEILTLLTGDFKAIKSGNETVDSLFGEDTPEPEQNGGGLSTDDMKPGDPATHQGYEPKAEPEPEKKSTKKDSPQTKADF